MNTPIISSTLLLTLLLMVGLFFFIRASVKDRTRQVKLIAEESLETLLHRLQQYFDQRSYQIAAVDAQENLVKFQGFVQPSWFLAIFLTCLAATGLFCLALVLSFLYPSLDGLVLIPILFAPASGIFYWQKAGRTEEVLLKVETIADEEKNPQSLVTVTAHRDEIIQLQLSLPLKPIIE